jgi:hypothetical protein
MKSPWFMTLLKVNVIALLSLFTVTMFVLAIQALYEDIKKPNPSTSMMGNSETRPLLSPEEAARLWAQQHPSASP